MKSLNQKKILVVDDEELLREIISEELSYYGAIVDNAENGKAALPLLQQNKYDALITDVRMPGGNGVELIKNITSLNIRPPVIFICSGFNDLNADDLINLNIAYHFTKPFDREEFIKIITNYLNGLQKQFTG